MPAKVLYHLTSRSRTSRSNRQLGGVLAAVAGAVNAGGFLAVQRYTSHMTGVVSSIADDLVLGQLALAMTGASALLAFILGAAGTALLVNWARRRQMRGEFALPLMFEALVLLVVALLGTRHMASLADGMLVPSMVLVLCFLMGLQNAIATKISQAQIRSTHMTGVITDMGLEFGRLVYWNRATEANARHFVRANRDRLLMHATIVSLFFAGAVAGAFAFERLGILAAVPIAVLLMTLAAPPLLQDLRTAQAAATS